MDLNPLIKNLFQQSQKKEEEARSFTMNWQGYNNSITGNLSFVEEEKREISILPLPKRDGSCIGSYILSSSQGTWSIICDKINKSASGFKMEYKRWRRYWERSGYRGNVVSFFVSGV